MTTAIAERKKLAPAAALPEPIHPCRNQLSALLSEHAAITAGVEEFENRLNRAELDLNFAIENDSDQDIERHQSAVSVFNLKVSAKRATLGKLLAGLPAAISSAANEYSTLLLDERNRRVQALSERIATVLGADSGRLSEGRYLDDVLNLAEPIQEIDRLRFDCNLVGATPQVTLSEVHRLLDYFGEIVKASREDV